MFCFFTLFVFVNMLKMFHFINFSSLTLWEKFRIYPYCSKTILFSKYSMLLIEIPLKVIIFILLSSIFINKYWFKKTLVASKREINTSKKGSENFYLELKILIQFLKMKFKLEILMLLMPILAFKWSFISNIVPEIE